LKIHKLKPASRLTIIFILAVFLSGSVLTYFSINNISNLKELTEKKILEEQQELSARFTNSIQNNIEKVTVGLNAEIGFLPALKDSLIKRKSEYDFIIQPFILKNNWQFQYPNFIGITENLTEAELSSGFKSAFRKGEEAEYVEKESRKAKGYYLSCLGYSTGSSDSVKALNALGRVSVKLNDVKNAITYYSLIISEYFPLTDENGLPYANYALPQLLKIINPDNRDKILPAVEFCLGKMETGSIPLNFSSEELLNLVKYWLKKNTFSNHEESANVYKLIVSTNQQIQFAITYRNELSELLKKGNSDNHIPYVNDFKVVNLISGNNQEFFLINTNGENITGFLTDRKKLYETILRTDLQYDLEFNYRIDFPDSYNSETRSGNLIYSSQLNPWFPDQEIEINLINKNLIKDIINRRGLIYGIASLLLLVAMLLGVILILRDIRRENHLARLRSDFISNVTHELKTPLTSIRMYAESLIMERVKSDSEQKEYLSIVVTETDRLKRMINNILEFSKMEKGKPEYHFVNSNLASILNASIQEMNYWFEKEHFEVVTELDETIYAEVDPEKITQAISNLLSNAIKYSTDIKKVFIRLFRKPDHICIEVEDRGIGIPEDRLSRIFEQFYRIEQKENISGTGLGLTVVKEIIESHGGTIKVESEIGKGSRFTIVIPAGGN
jgi:two-component system phosphate regulon sensor histidine kinase PhoR